jgi:hypothetical protein
MPSAIQRMEVYQSVPGLQDSMSFPEAASQSFKEGQLVRVGLAADTGKDGQLMACAGEANELVMGIALQDASGTENTMIPVQIIYPGITQLRVSAYHVGGAASSVLAAANVGKVVPFSVVSNKCVLNVADIGGSSGDEIMTIVGIDPQWAAGTYYGRAICTLVSANCQICK